MPEMSNRSCPDCHVALNTETIHETHIDVCPQCAGVWFDDGELTALQQRGLAGQVDDLFTPSVQRWSSGGRLRTCPVCPEVVLDEYSYMYSTPVRIDACPACHGLWVQDGELKQMERLAYQAHQEPVSAGVQHEIALAELEGKQEEVRGRHRMFQRVMRVINMRRPGIF